MSNYLAIATVTAVLREILQEAANKAIDGAKVTTGRPEQGRDSKDKDLINLFLYQVTPSVAWGNADLPTRSADGRLVRRPQAALDLHYLLSFYGDESKLVPQRLLGRVVSVLHARPLLSQDQIQNLMIDSQFDYLRESNLGEQIERVRFSPLSLNLEELSKLWSVFFQVPYALSVAYQASVVLIEAQEEMPQPALPVLKLGKDDHGWDSVVGGIPQIEQILPQFVEPGAEITLKGRNLLADRFTVLFGQSQVEFDPKKRPVLTPAGDLQVRLPSDLSAGIIPVSVRTGRGITSNTVALMLRPVIRELKQETTGENGSKSVTFKIEPKVQPGQRGLLLLNERKDDIQDPPRGYSIAFTVPLPQDLEGSEKCQVTLVKPENSEEPEICRVTVRLPQDPKDPDKCQVQAGTYLVRVQIDGAESQLEPPTSDDKPYAGPRVEIP